jgi:hypothetical protein
MSVTKSANPANLLAGVVELYATYQPVTTSRLAQIYSDTLVFRDPVQQLAGLDDFCAYLNAMGTNLNYCRFEFVETNPGDTTSWMRWIMRYSHPKLRRGADLTLEGASVLHHDERVTFQQDYYDMGAMLYEHIPLLGSAVGQFKKRLAH